MTHLVNKRRNRNLCWEKGSEVAGRGCIETLFQRQKAWGRVERRCLPTWVGGVRSEPEVG